MKDHSYRDVAKTLVQDYDSTIINGNGVPWMQTKAHIWMCGASDNGDLTKEECILERSVTDEAYIPEPFPEHLFEPFGWTQILSTLDIYVNKLTPTKFCDEEGYDLVTLQMASVILESRSESDENEEESTQKVECSRIVEEISGPKKTLPKPEGTLPKQELERLICYNDRYFKANNTDCVKTKDCMWILIDNVTVHCDLARVINRLADFEEIRDADVQYFEEYILQWLDSLKSKKLQLISTVPILGHTKILTKFKDPEVVFENVLVQKAGSLFTAVKDDRHIVLIQTNSSSFEILDLFLAGSDYQTYISILGNYQQEFLLDMSLKEHQSKSTSKT
ncbi:hypothetical protein L7F22_031628 [Adiantum nelumboides]|nr:hypothetical protein [Adiantum nelumboides]